MVLPHLDPLHVLFLVIILGAAYSSYDKRKKLLCTFRKKDNGYEQKWVKIKDDSVEFDGKLYDVMPDRTYSRLWTGGFFNAIIPIFVKCSDYRWDSRRPLDPKTFTNSWEDNPTVRSYLNKQQAIADWVRGSRQSMGMGKQTLLQRYYPFIMVCGLILIGYLVIQVKNNQDQLGAAVNYLQEQMSRIGK